MLRKVVLLLKDHRLLPCTQRVVDEVVFPGSAGQLPLASADPYLNSLLIKYCDEALSHRRAKSRAWRLNVENAIAPLLPHGQARIAEVSQRLGVSPRTLGRRLEYIGYGRSGKQVRDLLHIDDLVALVDEQLRDIDRWAGLTFNVGGGRDVSGGGGGGNSA